MKEFGSDFHYCQDLNHEMNNPMDFVFYANGRQALQDLVVFNKWKRIWIPTYFCYEVVEAIKETGIHVAFYTDAPTFDDINAISKISFLNEDVLLRMNYFGLRTWRDNAMIPVSVIEDHSHDLNGDWVKNSNADWCIASLRKTLPLPEGGVVWSPKKHTNPTAIESTMENELLSYKRFSAMLMKSLYLENLISSKDTFRKLYLETEEDFVKLRKSSISTVGIQIYRLLDISDLNHRKKDNWNYLASVIQEDGAEILHPENSEKCTPFSLIIKFETPSNREFFRKALIDNHVYPAVLWKIPDLQCPELGSIADTLLSIHCDARYNKAEMCVLGDIINNAFSKSRI